MASGMDASVISYRHARELPADALALLQGAERQHIEFGADWYSNLVDSVYAQEGRADAVRFHVLSRQGRALAILPTVEQTSARGREIGALSNFYTAIFAPALEAGVGAEDLLPLTKALRHGAQAASYRFAPMDPASREFATLRRALALAGLKVYDYFAFGNWYEPVSQGWAQYLSGRSGQVRSTIKRNAKKFEAEGGRLEIVQHEGEALDAALAAYQVVYAQSWKVPEPYPDFVPGLIKLCARRGWLRLGLAWLGSKPVAAQIWIVANGRADIYKLAYDEAHKAFAPGTLLTAKLMEHAIDVDHVHEIDYLIGDDPYKAAWMSRRRERVGLIAYDPLKLRGLLGLVQQNIGTAWRRLRTKHDSRA